MNHHSTGKTIAKDIYIDGQTSYTKRYTVSTSSKTSHVDGQVQQSDPQTTRTHLHSKFVVPKSMIATVTEIRMPLGIALPIDIARGPDTAYWVTDLQGNSIDRVNNEGTITTYPLLTDNAGVEGITTGSDGALWFAESNSIGRIKTDGTITEYTLPRNNASSLGLTSGPDNAIWFTEDTMNRIGRISTNGNVTEYALPKPDSSPTGITQGPDGALWFVEPTGNRIGRITTNGMLTEFPLPTKDSVPFSITCGSNGALWFTERNANTIGSLTPTGHFTEFAVPTSTSVLSHIGNIGDGTLAFSEEKANQIGRINAEGAISEFPLPIPNAMPFSITNGGHGTVWFTETNIGQIGRITFPPVTPTQADMTIHQHYTEAAPSQIGKHIDIAISASNAASGAAVTQEKSVTIDTIVSAGLSSINVTGGPNWQIVFTSSTSPTFIHSTYIGKYPIAPGATLAPITISGALTASAIPNLIITGIITVPQDSNLYNNIATDTITTTTS